MNKFKILIRKRPQGLFLFLAISVLILGLSSCVGDPEYAVGFDLEYKSGDGILPIPLDSALVSDFQTSYLSGYVNVPAHRAISTDDFFIVTGLITEPKQSQLKKAMEAEGKVFTCDLALPDYLEGEACSVTSEILGDFVYGAFTSEGGQFTHISIVVPKTDSGLDKFNEGGFKEWLQEN